MNEWQRLTDLERDALGFHVRAYRRSRGMSLQALAMEMEMDHTQIHKIEVMKKNPTVRTALRFAEQMGLSLKDITAFPGCKRLEDFSTPEIAAELHRRLS